jgi:tetratricopeptide (TPR) repeat protein
MAIKVGNDILEATRTPEPSVVVSRNRSTNFMKRWRWPLVIILVVIVLVIVGVVVRRNHKTDTPVSKNPVVTSYQQKLPSLQQAVQKNPNSAADHVAYAEALYVTGDKTGAKTQYIAAAKLNPSDATIQNNLGNTYRDLGDTTAAVAAYKQAIKLAPTNQNAYVNLANLQIYTLHEPADGVATYQQAIQKIGSTAQFELLLGLAYEQNGQAAKAKQTYQAILDSDPTNQAAKDNLARLQ